MLRGALGRGRTMALSVRSNCGSTNPSQIESASPSPLIRSGARAERNLAESLEMAQHAVVIAAEVNADDIERNQSVALSKRAFFEYDGLLKQTERAPAERTRLETKFGSDIEALKHDLFMSRKQRVWMAVHGWL
jgi:hypothetical protein